MARNDLTRRGTVNADVERDELQALRQQLSFREGERR
jgi:hypothetical protein